MASATLANASALAKRVKARLVAGARRAKPYFRTRISARMSAFARHCINKPQTEEWKERVNEHVQGVQDDVGKAAAVSALSVALSTATPDLAQAASESMLGAHAHELSAPTMTRVSSLPQMALPEAPVLSDDLEEQEGAPGVAGVVMGSLLGGLGLAVAKTREHAQTDGAAAAALLSVVLLSMEKITKRSKPETPAATSTKTKARNRHYLSELEEELARKLRAAYDTVAAASKRERELNVQLQKAQARVNAIKERMPATMTRMEAAIAEEAPIGEELYQAEAALRYYSTLDADAHAAVIAEVTAAVDKGVKAGKLPKAASQLVRLLEEDDEIRTRICELEANVDMMSEHEINELQNVKSEMDGLNFQLELVAEEISLAVKKSSGFVDPATIAHRVDTWDLSVYAARLVQTVRVQHKKYADALADAMELAKEDNTELQNAISRVEKVLEMINTCRSTVTSQRAEVKRLQQELADERARRESESESGAVAAA